MELMNDSVAFVANLQSVHAQYEQKLLKIANNLDSLAVKTKSPEEKERAETLNLIRKLLTKWRRSTSLSAELFTEVALELRGRSAEIRHMQARIDLNTEMLKRARVENDRIKILTETLKTHYPI